MNYINAIETTDTNNLWKKAEYKHKNYWYWKKIVGHDHSNKYISTLEFNRLSAKNFAARLKQADLATKVNIDSLVWKISFNNKLKKLNKRLLQIKQNI